jgi:UDP:flavonoid glycosyltransferase YjiC (YdhE family)
MGFHSWRSLSQTINQESRRIRHSKVGDFVGLADLTDEALERIARAVLSSPLYRAAALRMRNAIEKADGLRSATECIHSVFGTRKM